MSKNIDKIVNRFLGWKLPKDFAPAGGISFKPSEHPYFWPVGTHLFTADQAKAMFEYCLRGVQQAEQEPVAYVGQLDDEVIQHLQDKGYDHSTPLYAAPVHTVDLTDGEVVDVMNKIYGPMWTEQDRDFARAVIAADREKNK